MGGEMGRGPVSPPIFGIVFALLLQALGWAFQDRLVIVKILMQILSAFVAYFLARALIPIGDMPSN